MLLARAGMSVLVVDRGREGTDTLSTHALMRAAVLQLHRWGLLEPLQRRGTPTVRSTTFHYGDEPEIAVHLKPRDGVDGLCAPRRIVLDQLLVESARASGAEIVFGSIVTAVVRDDAGRVTGVVVKDVEASTRTISAGLVIGADGMHSSVADLVGARAYRTAKHTTSVIFNYFPIGLQGYHWYYRPGVSAGCIPTNDGLTCVFVSVPPRRFEQDLREDVAAGHARIVRECSAELASHVEAVAPAQKFRGFGGLLGYMRQSVGPGWALVGDAGYFKDPLTAHGMTDALVDAEHLARAVAARSDDALAAYQRERDERSTTFFDATDRVASFEWDLDELKGLHKTLSEEMKREAAGVLALDG